VINGKDVDNNADESSVYLTKYCES
jgi:hypothetical protein